MGKIVELTVARGVGRPEWVPEGELFWWARQARLATPTYGDQLTRAEVLFMEKFEALGERAEWIPKTRAAKTADFYWTSRDGRPWDIKSPSLEGWGTMTVKQQYKRIAGRISDDAPFKKNVVVDLGSEVLTDELAQKLAEYNAGRWRTPEHLIRKLVILADSVLRVIPLRMEMQGVDLALAHHMGT